MWLVLSVSVFSVYRGFRSSTGAPKHFLQVPVVPKLLPHQRRRPWTLLVLRLSSAARSKLLVNS